MNGSKFLIVDDVESARRVLRRLLIVIGYEFIDEAANVDEAFALAENNKYDVIICDLHLKGMTGIDLFSRLKILPEYSGVPFLIITSDADREEFVRAKQAGISHYLLKPFNAEALNDAVSTVMTPIA